MCWPFRPKVQLHVTLAAQLNIRSISLRVMAVHKHRCVDFSDWICTVSRVRYSKMPIYGVILGLVLGLSFKNTTEYWPDYKTKTPSILGPWSFGPLWEPRRRYEFVCIKLSTKLARSCDSVGAQPEREWR
jgi:hypothetical protein